MEIFDSLTLEKQSSLQLPKPTGSYHYLDYPPIKLSYSPDGHSLVGFFHSAIIIWDIQTVGVVKEIKCSTCPTSLVWSFDGQTIGTVYEVKAKTWVVCAYDIDLGVKVSTGTLQSSLEPCLWSHNKPLQAITILSGEDSQIIINIFAIWPTFINTSTKSLSIQLNLPHVILSTMSFSPAFYHISMIIKDHNPTYSTLIILYIQSSKVLPLEESIFTTSCFSPDGSLLVASGSNGETVVWKYCPEEGYTKWIRFPTWSDSSGWPQSHLFSPTLLSVLISRECSLEVKHLDNPSTIPLQNRYQFLEEFSTNGKYVVTAPYGEQTITITNLNGICSHSIKPGFNVYGLALTNNILLVDSIYEFAAWHLTKKGMVDEIIGNGTSNKDGRL